MRVVAFYLPQYHPIAENDGWWGKGFTEWRNVAEAKPQFVGHDQPKVPSDLGFYDLRVPETREAQADLAQAHGISAFCYYYYWFDGRRVLERPLNDMLQAGRPQFPFCLCWANENWTRRWDGNDQEVLLAQRYAEGYETKLFQDVLPALRDERYLRVGDRPLFLVYRTELLPDARRFADTWRRLARANGVADPFLVRCEAFARSDPASDGFDAAYQFPPNGSGVDFRVPVPDSAPRTLHMYDYRSAASVFRNDRVAYKRIPGVMVDWDNTARRGPDAHVFRGSTPTAFGAWLAGAMDEARSRLAPDEQLVFVNAWNEWAEGCYLEPDRKRGRSYLEEVAKLTRAGRPGTTEDAGAFEVDGLLHEVALRLSGLEREIAVRDRSISALVAELYQSQRLPWEEGAMRRALSEQWASRSWSITRPLRNWVLRRRGAREESPEAMAASDVEAILGLLALHHSVWWELAGPLRVVGRVLQHARKQV